MNLLYIIADASALFLIATSALPCVALVTHFKPRKD